MRYAQTKEKCAEVLRQVLASMGQHDAAFNPVSFTVWFEHYAGMNLRLSHALEKLLQTKPRLGDDDIGALYDDFVADVDPQAMHRIGGELRQVMSGLLQAAARTGDDAGAFGSQLEQLATELQKSIDQSVAASVSLALQGTSRMQASTQQLVAQVQNSHGEVERLQSELTRVRDESLRDTLTRVHNRRGFDIKLADMLLRAPLADRLHGLIMFDIDHFKNVNDTRGHVMGDRVLQAVGEVLLACVPINSAVTVARYGGEEFAMLVPDSSVQQCQQLAEQVRTRIKALKIRDRRTQEVVLTVTLSAGVAMCQRGDDAATLTTRADTALYQSKNNGRDRVTVA